MTNLDSILKSRAITLLTKAYLVKAMVFPVVTHGCESWTVKNAECQRTDELSLSEGHGLLRLLSFCPLMAQWPLTSQKVTQDITVHLVLMSPQPAFGC